MPITQRPGRLGWEIHVANPEAAKKIFLKHGKAMSYRASSFDSTNLFS